MIALRKSEPKPVARNAKRILVIKLEGLAEFVQALAAARAIREHHVGARITLLTTEAFKDIAEKCPYFDTVEADGKPREPQATAQLIARIRAAKFDMIYDLENSNRTNTYFQGLRPWPPNWSGTAQGCSHQVSEADRAPLHALDQLGLQLRLAGIEMGVGPMPDLTWVRAALRDPPRLQPDYFGIRGRFVLLTPRGGEDLPKRRWPYDKYAELARRIADGGVTPVVLGGPADRDAGAAIVKAEPRTKNLVARPDFFQCVALAERAAFAVGDDVDLLHVAASAGATCVVLLSAREPQRVAPRGSGGVVALTAAVVADLPVDLVDRQLRNCGAYPVARSA